MNHFLLSVIFSVLSVFSVVKSPLANIGPAPEVALVDQSDRPFRLSGLRGKVVLVSFVYTTCNGSCPATTREMVRVKKALEKEGLWGKKVEFVSISLDPERDTPEVLARYAKQFGAESGSWHFLTGPTARVDKTIAAWDMWARRNASGVLDHPSRVFLVDPRGRQREIYSLVFLTPEAVVADARGLLAEAEEP